jgi:acetyltransferase-like isoleucine patch superfamily enzyme
MNEENMILVRLADGRTTPVSEFEGLRVEFFGKGNVIEIDEGSVFQNCHFRARDTCHISIGRTNPRGLKSTSVDMLGAIGCSLTIGEDASIESARFAMASDRDLSVTIGRGCLMSSNIVFRATDGHVILSKESGKLLNESKPIVIGDNVWIGAGVTILKGARVSNDSIIGTMAVLSRKFEEPNVAIAGNPAAVVRRGVCWNRTHVRDWTGPR